MIIPKLFAPPTPIYRTRRDFLKRVGNGFGLLALAGLLEQEGLLGNPARAAEVAVNPMAPKLPHFPSKAKSVIWLFMNGGPSHVDTWDYNQELAQPTRHGVKGCGEDGGWGFVPGIYQGTALKSQGPPIEDLQRNPEMTSKQQRAQLDLLGRLKRRQLQLEPGEPELAARIESFELAYRMQMAAPEALDINKETQAVQKLYGLDNPKSAPFGKQCLMARRLIERGVRFVQIYSGGEENEKSWDGHLNIVQNHTGFAAETDLPIAGLLTDLESRGLLDSTLVIWGGEFGRLPIVQKGGTGRDHNPHAFTTWLAGAGVKSGTLYGKTDEIGHKAIVDRVSINDLHATILHFLGIDHKRLTYRYSGRDFRLTDVAGNVVKENFA